MVFVIEERDKRTHIYIAIAAVLGLAFGGLVGSIVTANKWESTYHVLEEKYQVNISSRITGKLPKTSL